MIDCLSSSPSCFASWRIIASSGDPAADVQMNLMVLVGYSAAGAAKARLPPAGRTRSAASRHRRTCNEGLFIGACIVLIVPELPCGIGLIGTGPHGVFEHVESQAGSIGQLDVAIDGLKCIGAHDAAEFLVRQEIFGDDEV